MDSNTKYFTTIVLYKNSTYIDRFQINESHIMCKVKINREIFFQIIFTNDNCMMKELN